ncbi:unnamed protein product [Acanthocheilonema viteae]|uniref:DUF1758 domain-containing protein n=1 Tax=Acanthocheilonema viteae TaxID=6277 RepID=A0A498SN30_ACAVI|nr:unnamed protein product [Acanthocheilonema viteae]
MLESVNQQWLDRVEDLSAANKKREKERYFAIIIQKGIFDLITTSKRNVSTLELHIKDVETALNEMLREERRNEITPRTSSTAAPLLTKLNYLILSPKEGALLAVKGFDIVPKNYSVLYEKNDKEWKTTIDAMERIPRQLEALGGNLEHPSIESIMETVVKPTKPAELKQNPERRKARRPCIFCNKDHWNNKWKPTGQTNFTLIKEINVVNPNHPELQQRALVLFGIGSQLTLMSKRLAKRLNLQGTDEKELKFASFGSKIPQTCLTTKIEIGVKISKG